MMHGPLNVKFASFSYSIKISPTLQHHGCLFCHGRSGLQWHWNSLGI